MPGPTPTDSAPRCFLASIDGRKVMVELDNAAALKVAGRTVDVSRARIAEAVRQLIDKGHVVERNGALEVIVTALDL